jgi:hypothetical protein
VKSGCMRSDPRLEKTMMKVDRQSVQSPGIRIGEGSSDCGVEEGDL